MPANETPDLQPDDLESLQAEPAYQEPAVKVCVVEIQAPVRTQALPRKQGATRTRTVGTTPVKLLSADHRRAQATLMSVGQNMLVAMSNASAQDPTLAAMALWPQNVPLVINADSDVYVASATATTSISIITEFWATGE